MGKYEPLAARLSREKEYWDPTFAELEAVLGFPLPPSARRHREWWSNQRGGGHSQAKGWQDAGWQVHRVDLAGERVEFRHRSMSPSARSPSASPATDEELIARAADYLGTTDRQRIVREALEALCAREAGRRLARLGGTMPDLKIPPRRRPPY